MMSGACSMRGADKVSINTAAVNNPGWWPTRAGKVGPVHRVAIDAKQTSPGKGRYSPTVAATIPGLDAIEWAQTVALRSSRQRNPAHQHGSRRHQDRFRSRPDASRLPMR